MYRNDHDVLSNLWCGKVERRPGEAHHLVVTKAVIVVLERHEKFGIQIPSSQILPETVPPHKASPHLW